MTIQYRFKRRAARFQGSSELTLAFAKFSVIVNYNTMSLNRGPAERHRQAEMKDQFIRLTSGWIPVSVLVLFTIALIAGQARANLPHEVTAAPAHSTETTWKNVGLSSDMVMKLHTLPLAIDTLLALPSDLEPGFDVGIIEPGKADNRPLRSNSQNRPR
jgi:hypothetical protein